MISIGIVATAIPFALQLAGMAGWLAWELMEVFENIGVTQESMGVIAQPIAITDRRTRASSRHAGEIRFEQASFGYGRDTAVIEDLTLAIRPGEKIGLIGRFGAGKSTLVNSAAALLRAGEGAYPDRRAGYRRRDAGEPARRHRHGHAGHLAAAPLGRGEHPLRPPLGLGRGVVAAARQSHADDFIRGLEDWKGRKGYDAHVGERGVKLSGGQRQRVAIARVILKNAPILVLDEATSALDSEVEAAIQESLADLMEGKTVIAIAHRLSTIARMDSWLCWTRAASSRRAHMRPLLAKGGHYAELWARQSGASSSSRGGPSRANTTRRRSSRRSERPGGDRGEGVAQRGGQLVPDLRAPTGIGDNADDGVRRPVAAFGETRMADRNAASS